MRRRFLIILIAIVILIALGVGVVFLVDRTPSLQNALTPNDNANTPVTTNTNTPVATNGNVNTNPDRAAIEYVARNFSELYGSGTTQNNLINIVEAKQWGTTNFNSYLDRIVTQERSKAPNPKFIRTMSSAVVIKIDKQTAATAAVTITLQRAESGDTAEKQYYQDIRLDLVKQGTTWKINVATWQPH